MDHIEHVYTVGMDEDAVAGHLRTADFGVLSLARENDAYAIPVAIHFDGERVLLRLGVDAESEKESFLRATERASLVVYDAADERESWSVLVRGPVERMAESERETISEADINTWFAPFRVFDEAIEDVVYDLYELRPESVTGRRTAD